MQNRFCNKSHQLLTKEEKEFQKQFKNYIEGIPSERLGQLIHNYPGEKWRILLIKESGIKLPDRLQQEIKSFDKKEQYKNLIKDFSTGKDSSERQLYTEFYSWCLENSVTRPKSFHEFKQILNETASDNLSTTCDKHTCALLKMIVLV